MAFTKTPVNSTYQTKTIQLVKEIGSRGTTTAKDSFYLNAYAELVKNKTTKEEELIAVKRAGNTNCIASVGSGGIRGAHLWKDQNKIFLAIGTSVYVYNSNTLALITTLLAVYGTSSGEVGFEEFLYDDTSTKLVTSDGTTLSTISTSNVVVACVDVDMPVHHPQPIFLDGTLYVLKTASSSVYNSDINDPLSWTSAEFIDAEMRADQAVRIALLNNYLVVFGTKSIEYFYDNANSTGSPLSKFDSPMKAIGYTGGFAKYGNKVYFVGETTETLPDVYLLEDFKLTNLGTEATRRHLEAYNTSVLGALISFNGHDFYVITTTNATYALELESKLWSQWTYGAGSTFPINFSLVQNSTTSGYRNFFTTTADQSVYLFSNSVGQDNGTSFPVEIVTENEYFESYNQKTAHRMVIYADMPTATLPILVQTTDDDYQSYSTGQSIDLYQELPSATRWGRFRRRAHKLSYTGSLPLRIFKIELDINLGNS